MPLSEYEQRVLEQMERQLSADDPKLATTLTTPRHRTGRRIIVAVASLIVGLLLLILGVVESLIVVGILGFAVMLGGVTYAVLSPAPSETTGPHGIVTDDGRVRPRASGRGHGRSKTSGGSFMQRMEQRWDKRRDSGGF
ncbi:DUF3040 domain-containing protein [Sanguibacter sp. A247]|uniref:DUF3040 domain-containing protein n=1 Tax=unclassified Sanguibacter TaxID=2645534 RepID=UPI003FD86AFF